MQRHAVLVSCLLFTFLLAAACDDDGGGDRSLTPEEKAAFDYTN